MQVDKEKLESYLQRRMQTLREEKAQARRDGSTHLRNELSQQISDCRQLYTKINQGDFNLGE